MKKVDAFYLVDAEPLQNGKWLARGRAYVDIAIGDSLFLEDDVEFRVEYITTYRREVPELNSGLTGNLTLSGEQGIRLREVAHINITAILLYKKIE